MDRWIGRVSLVTGASAGIGASIAKSLVQNGMKVIGVSRNPEKIQAMTSELCGCSGKLFPMKCDVRNEAEVKRVFEYAKKELGGIDVCINNAGLAHDSPLLSADSATEDWRSMLETNVLAVCVFNREYMKQMKERGVDDGHIIILNSSILGHYVFNNSGGDFYNATKYAITVLASGIRFELRNMQSNIRISCISPGLVRTEFRERWKKEDHNKSMEHYDTAFYNGQVIESEDIANAVKFILSMPQRAEVNDIIIRPSAAKN